MAELTIDFAGVPDGPFRGTPQIPAPVNFIRALNQEGAPVRVSGPLPEPVALDYGLPAASTVEALAQVHDGVLYAHPPHRVMAPYGQYEAGFQTITQPVAVMACPNLHMRAHFVLPGLDRITPRKWVTFWAMPRDEWEVIGGLNSTPGDPDFVNVVQRRLPAEPYESIMWRHSGSPEVDGYNAWLVQSTRRRDGTPRKRNLEWAAIQKVGALDEHVMEIDGLNVRLLTWSPAAKQWVSTFGSAADDRTRDIIPPSWAGREIVLAVQFADYDSGDRSKGDGAGAATRRLQRVTIRAPFVAPIVGGVPPVVVEPPVEEPPVVEPEPEPPVVEEPEPPVTPDLRPGLERARALIDAELAALEATTA